MASTTIDSMSNIEDYFMVSERELQIAAERSAKFSPNEDDNVYLLALKNGQVYKDADMTPVYMVDPVNQRIGVTAVECATVTYH